MKTPEILELIESLEEVFVKENDINNFSNQVLINATKIYLDIRNEGFSKINEFKSFDQLSQGLQLTINNLSSGSSQTLEALDLILRQQSYLETHLQNGEPLFSDFIQFLENESISAKFEELTEINLIRQELVRNVKGQFMQVIFSVENVSQILFMASFKIDLAKSTVAFTSTKWLDASLRWSRGGNKLWIPISYKTSNNMGQNLLKWGAGSKDVLTPLQRAEYV